MRDLAAVFPEEQEMPMVWATVNGLIAELQSKLKCDETRWGDNQSANLMMHMAVAANHYHQFVSTLRLVFTLERGDDVFTPPPLFPIFERRLIVYSEFSSWRMWT